ncbi:MAG: hypothetical protein H6510_17775 [Acidobacteria bacterium]|nr:hypothetical protein [Acidobacteriota bacterium]MCB9399666.1 hypothetical protein [Acidobacteriota bacterium]
MVQPGPAPAGDGAHDFDFVHGQWHIHNRRLKARLNGCQEWLEFEAHSLSTPLPGGLGNQEIWQTEFWPDFVGMALRFYNPETRLWSIYWVDNTGAPGVLQPPVTGRFQEGVGIFEGDDIFAGQAIRVRFIWTHIDPDHARWEQAFSADQGTTWETNWVMAFTRQNETGQ